MLVQAREGGGDGGIEGEKLTRITPGFPPSLHRRGVESTGGSSVNQSCVIDSKLGGIWANFLLLLSHGFLTGCPVAAAFSAAGFDDPVCMGCGLAGLSPTYLLASREVFGV
ncbi:uncharacterized protein [Physcomitrium patens]|uniref:uncharacterized protein n=1 Tax=Physcomitrium patens TaxID=3218 RepID=UPI003CCE3872